MDSAGPNMGVSEAYSKMLTIISCPARGSTCCLYMPLVAGTLISGRLRKERRDTLGGLGEMFFF